MLAESLTSRRRGDVAVVTGAAGGLGQAYAAHLASRGWRLVLNDIDAAALARAAAQLGLGADVVIAHGDVRDSSTAATLVDAAMSRFGRLDALVNNAGIEVCGAFEDAAPEHMREALDVHVVGAMLCTQAALSVMVPRAYGRVVLTSSGIGVLGLRGATVHAAATAAVAGLARSLALELDGTGVLLNVVSPIASTRMSEAFFARHRELEQHRYQPTFVAPVLEYLCSRACAVNGRHFSVGGGRVAQVLSTVEIGTFHGADDVAPACERSVAADAPLALRSALDEFLVLEV